MDCGLKFYYDNHSELQEKLTGFYESGHLKSVTFFFLYSINCVCPGVFSELFVGYDTMRGLNSSEMLFWS